MGQLAFSIMRLDEWTFIYIIFSVTFEFYPRVVRQVGDASIPNRSLTGSTGSLG